MKDNWGQQVVQELKGMYSGFKNELRAYRPELTRRDWKRYKDDPAALNILAQKHGQANIRKWMQRNKLQDMTESGNGQ